MLIATRYHARMAQSGMDEEALAMLKIASWRETYPGILPQPVLDSLDFDRCVAGWRRALTRGIAWIGELGGQQVGFGHMRCNEVTMLYVRKADQGRGLGTSLLLQLFDEIGCLGHREAHLWVLEKNSKARDFYRHMGGVPTAKRAVGFARYPDIMEVRYDFRIDG